MNTYSKEQLHRGGPTAVLYCCKGKRVATRVSTTGADIRGDVEDKWPLIYITERFITLIF